MNSQVLVELLREALPSVRFHRGMGGNHKDRVGDLVERIVAELATPTPIPDADHIEDVRAMVVPDLEGLHKELQTLRWMGADEGWDRAIAAVSGRIEEMLAASPAPGGGQ